MAEWYFPTNGGGQIRGLADAGIETFKGQKNSSLAREICQNSLDAAADLSNPVIVNFTLKEIKPEQIPGYTEYKKVLRECRNFWAHNATAKNFFDNAITKFETPCNVLIISDENTTGLANPFDANSFEGWNTLTKISGGANKFGGSGLGSYGIGKNAPFAMSDFRLVFYRTLNKNNERAAQGISRLVSFQKNNFITAGIGYFGDAKNILPVDEIPALEKILPRTKIGTDIFIFGFNATENWIQDIYFELIENFLLTIYQEKLIAKIQGYTLNKNTLQKVFAESENYFKKRKSQALNYFKVLTAPPADLKIFEEDFHGLGKIKLKVFTDLRADFNRKVLIVRQMGMKIFDMKNFSRQISFSGIAELEGAALNNFFRQMENPEHNNWEPERHPNKKAQKYLDEFKNFVRDSVKTLCANSVTDETNVKGLSANLQRKKFLPVTRRAVKKVENINPVANSQIVKLENFTAPENKTLSSGGGNDSSKYKRTRGTITDAKGDAPAIRTLKGKRPRKNKISHTGIENPEGADIVLAPAGNFIECKNRVIKTRKNYYRLILQMPKNLFSGCIKIFAVGEDDSQEQLKISRGISNCNAVFSEEKIQISNIPANKTLHINFSLAEENDYSLRAYVYEDE